MNGRCVSKAVLAISEQGRLAIAKESESLVELYGGGRDGGLHEFRPANQIITQFLATPSSICFAPNEHLVIADSGTKSVLVYSLQEEPHFVSRIIFYWKNGNVVIERVTRARSRIRSSRGLLAPFNVVAGSSPLSQLFVVLEGLIFVTVITMDWNTVELIDYQQLSSSRDWSCMQFKEKQQCSKASIVHDHADNHKVGGQNPLAVTTGQFCAMFYHVTERRKDKINYVCLHKPLCRVGKMAGQVMTRAGGYAATVVVYVRLTDHSGRLMFHARYGNCSEGQRRNTIHAEYFMLMDEEFRQAVKCLQEQRGGNIIMYMNKQPCFRSTKHNSKIPGLKRKECAQNLVDFFTLNCSGYFITMSINLCQLYKVDMLPSPSLEEDIVNARQGMQKMIAAGIELKAMSEESWTQLASFADIKLPQYEGSERQKLDQHITQFIHGMETGGSAI